MTGLHLQYNVTILLLEGLVKFSKLVLFRRMALVFHYRWPPVGGGGVGRGRGGGASVSMFPCSNQNVSTYMKSYKTG